MRCRKAAVKGERHGVNRAQPPRSLKSLHGCLICATVQVEPPARRNPLCGVRINGKGSLAQGHAGLNVLSGVGKDVSTSPENSRIVGRVLKRKLG